MTEVAHHNVAALLALAKRDRDEAGKSISVFREHALAERALRRLEADPGPFAGAIERLAAAEAALAQGQREVEELTVAERLLVLRDLDRGRIASLEASLTEATRKLELSPNYAAWNAYYHDGHRTTQLQAEHIEEWNAFLKLKNQVLDLSQQLAMFTNIRAATVGELPAGMRQILAGDEWRAANRRVSIAPSPAPEAAATEPVGAAKRVPSNAKVA